MKVFIVLCLLSGLTTTTIGHCIPQQGFVFLIEQQTGFILFLVENYLITTNVFSKAESIYSGLHPTVSLSALKC